MKLSQMFFFVELFILFFHVHEHISLEVFLRLNYSYSFSTYTSTSPRHFTTKTKHSQTHITTTNNTHTDHHPWHSHPMAVTANTPCRGDRPPPRGNTEHETTAKGGKARKKHCASDGGNTEDKSHKRSSAEGGDNKNENAGTNGAPGDGERMTATDVRDKSSTKGDGVTTPHDHDAETMDKGTKGRNKRSASYDGNTVDKSHTRSSVKGDDDKKMQAQMERLGMANV